MSPRPTTLVIANLAWDFVWQRHQTMASLFARDSEVIFCEIPGIRRLGWSDAGRVLARFGTLVRHAPPDVPLPAGVRIVRPLVLPATNGLFHAANSMLLQRFLRREPGLTAGVDLILNYTPSRTAMQLLDRVPHRRLVYDCTDDWLAVRNIPACLPDDERALLARADLTLVSSHRLEILKRPHARRLERLPHGALGERFLRAPKPRPTDGALTVLYYGHLYSQHLDFAAIETMARARPGWRVILVGPVKTPHAFPPNVELPGQQPHEKLREFVARADVLLLPYALNEYTRAVMPAKTYECLATGRPIVATPLPELVENFAAHLRFASGPEAWAPAVEEALRAQTPESRAAQIDLAQRNTWESRYTRVRELLAPRD